jgi:hypothetical protein
LKRTWWRMNGAGPNHILNKPDWQDRLCTTSSVLPNSQLRSYVISAHKVRHALRKAGAGDTHKTFKKV